ncbi:MAG TPA: fasciclin domain-containing protein [Coriobacteriia bacterium]|jgi:uncharacterized surface protein with fasciclin (FAS1) repeats
MRIRFGITAALFAALLLAACTRTVTSPTAVTTGSPAATESISQTGPPTAPPSAETTVAGDAKKPVAELLKVSGELSTMSRLLDAAGLSVVLGGKRENTLFAPTNAAFDALPTGMLASLEQPANKEKLRRLLRYHLVIGRVPSSQMVTIKRVMTYEGGVLAVASKDGTVTVEGAVKVIQPDVPASNGYVDVIDTVLVPPGFKP